MGFLVHFTRVDRHALAHTGIQRERKTLEARKRDHSRSRTSILRQSERIRKQVIQPQRYHVTRPLELGYLGVVKAAQPAKEAGWILNALIGHGVDHLGDEDVDWCDWRRWHAGRVRGEGVLGKVSRLGGLFLQVVSMTVRILLRA
jgi:hypothetical protein